ncbi:hypothetical protein SAMN05428939_6530 [Streptomyces sp. TLI_105]|nr:hypothetical protein SAMN05428939_6530 [Streptomyces sp. TLI_105]
MRASADCPSILHDATPTEVFAGQVYGWLLLAGVVSWIIAAFLWWRHESAQPNRYYYTERRGRLYINRRW